MNQKLYILGCVAWLANSRIIKALSKTEGLIESSMHELLSPTLVWTGSFNFSKTAENSFENAIIENPDVALAYANEFAQIFALSELLLIRY